LDTDNRDGFLTFFFKKKNAIFASYYKRITSKTGKANESDASKGLSINWKSKLPNREGMKSKNSIINHLACRLMNNNNCVHHEYGHPYIV
jgi:hypothetical protein